MTIIEVNNTDNLTVTSVHNPVSLVIIYSIISRVSNVCLKN